MKKKLNFKIFEILKIFEIFLKCWKMLCCEHRHYKWSPNFISFALSLTVAEICANLCFFEILKKNNFVIPNFLIIPYSLSLFLYPYFLTYPYSLSLSLSKFHFAVVIFLVIPNFCPFRSISYGFWLLNLKFKF